MVSEEFCEQGGGGRDHDGAGVGQTGQHAADEVHAVRDLVRPRHRRRARGLAPRVREVDVGDDL